MAEINSSTAIKGKRSFTRSVNRLSTKVDLTPMVDLGFLLITFFVFTTTMSQSSAMDLAEPDDKVSTLRKQSGIMTILPGSNHELYYYYGKLSVDSPANQVQKSSFKVIRNLIVQKKKETDIEKLMYLIKPGENSTFGDAVSLLNEMTICDIPNGHYIQMDISKAESDLIQSIN